MANTNLTADEGKAMLISHLTAVSGALMRQQPVMAYSLLRGLIDSMVATWFGSDWDNVHALLGQVEDLHGQEVSLKDVIRAADTTPPSTAIVDFVETLDFDGDDDDDDDQRVPV